MTTTEAATRAGVSGTVVKRWLKRGDVAGTKERGVWTVDEASLEAYLARPRLKGRPQKGTYRLVTPLGADDCEVRMDADGSVPATEIERVTLEQARAFRESGVEPSQWQWEYLGKVE